MALKNETTRQLIEAVRELAEQVSYDETGGFVEVYVGGERHGGLRHMACALPPDVNESLLRILTLADKLEASLKESENGK